jgi:hypothetical protein
VNSLDADGPEECLELESSEDSEEDQIDALPIEKEDGLKPSAGISEEYWLKDSWEVEEDALSIDKDTEFSLDASEELSENTDGEDSTSEVLESSRDTLDKVKDVLSMLEAKVWTLSSLDANGLDPGEELDSLEDTTEDQIDATSGEEEISTEPSAGTIDWESSRDSPLEEEDASNTKDNTESGPDASEEEEDLLEQESSEDTPEETEDMSSTEEEEEPGPEASWSEREDLEQLSSEDSKKEINGAILIEEEEEPGPDASLLEPESSEDSIEEEEDASFIEEEERPGPDASEDLELESSRDSIEEIEDVSPIEEEEEPGLDASEEE